MGLQFSSITIARLTISTTFTVCYTVHIHAKYTNNVYIMEGDQDTWLCVSGQGRRGAHECVIYRNH